ARPGPRGRGPRVRDGVAPRPRAAARAVRAGVRWRARAAGDDRPPRGGHRAAPVRHLGAGGAAAQPVRAGEAGRDAAGALRRAAPARARCRLEPGGVRRRRRRPRAPRRRTEDVLALLRHLFSGGGAPYTSRRFSCEQGVFASLPAVPVPLVVGGQSDAALRRAARYGDAWQGMATTPAQYTRLAGRLADLAGDREVAATVRLEW